MRAINNSALQAQNVQTALKTAAEDQQQIATLRLGIGLPHTFFGSDEEGYVGDMSTFTLFNEKKHTFLSQLFSLLKQHRFWHSTSLFDGCRQARDRRQAETRGGGQ